MNEMSDSAFRLGLLGTFFILALIAEAIWPLRKATQPKAIRLVRNLGVAITSLVFVRFAFLPLEISVASFVTERNIGLLNQMDMNPILKISLSLILLDFTFYYWHWINHRLPFLWRFHNTHHIDLDLDVSTATRFHVGELAISSIFRSGQIFLLGIDVSTLLIFETCITSFALFHHSNVRLPIGLEVFLGRVFITPRMHGIHHSIVRSETDSNYGTIFSIWDRLHRSFCFGIPQDKITVGVPSYRDPKEHKLWNVLNMPFQKQRAWKLPSGEVPKREASLKLKN